MRITFFVAAALTALVSGPLGAQSGPPVCTPSGPPTAPSSSDENPGYVGTAGLNSDFHDEFYDPLDHPGQVIGPVTSDTAQNGAAGGVHLLRDAVGHDCPKG